MAAQMEAVGYTAMLDVIDELGDLVKQKDAEITRLRENRSQFYQAIDQLINALNISS